MITGRKTGQIVWVAEQAQSGEWCFQAEVRKIFRWWSLRELAVTNEIVSSPGLPSYRAALILRDVPVNGFWSITIYNGHGYLEPNPLGRGYSLNNVTRVQSSDGSYTLRFGGDSEAENYLAIMPGWNYLVRLYRPRPEVLDGSWVCPEATPVDA